MHANAPTSPQDLLTINEIARLLRCSQMVVRGAIDRGDLIVRRIGPRCLRIARTDFDRWWEALPSEKTQDDRQSVQ